jgi:quercetin dioxygenase-like cupin family protein
VYLPLSGCIRSNAPKCPLADPVSQVESWDWRRDSWFFCQYIDIATGTADEASAGPARLWFLNTEVTIRVSETDGGDKLSVLEHFAPFGDSPPLHRHLDEDEIFHILSGTLRFDVGGRAIEARAGETLRAPKQVPHTYRVESREGARWLSVTAHGQFERFVLAFGRPPTRAGLPDPSGPPTPEQAEALAAECRKYRIEILGPPLP